MSAVQRVIDVLGGERGGMAELARRLTAARPDEKPVTPQRVWVWKEADRIPAEFCPDIERISGIACEELRPDVAWGVLREQAKKKREATA